VNGRSAERKPLALRLLNRPGIAIVAVVAAALRLWWIVYVSRPPNVQLDFSTFYIAAWAFRHHLNPFRMELTPYAQQLGVIIGPIRHANLPPTFFLLLEPLTYLSPWTAYWVWSIFSAGILLISLVLLFPLNKLPLSTAAIFISLGIIYRPIQIHFEFLQVQIAILFLLILMWRALRNGHDIAAGIYLAVAGLIRAYPLFMLLYLICTGRWRAIASTAFAVAIGFALTLALVGAAALSFFPTVLVHVDPAVGVPMVPTVGLAGSLVRITRYFNPNDSDTVAPGNRYNLDYGVGHPALTLESTARRLCIRFVRRSDDSGVLKRMGSLHGFAAVAAEPARDRGFKKARSRERDRVGGNWLFTGGSFIHRQLSGSARCT
jgi:Glycosyltransferase family 87